MFRKISITSSLAIVVLWLGWLTLNGASMTKDSHEMTYQKTESALGSACVLDTSDATFQHDVLNVHQPVFVDFYATWCGPCRSMTPVVEELSVRYKNKVRFFRVDVDRNPQLAANYQIQSIPALKIFHGGKIVDSALGVTEELVLTEKIDRVISSGGTSGR